MQDCLDMKGIPSYWSCRKMGQAGGRCNEYTFTQADCRMEVLAVHAAMQGADRESVCRIMQCLNTTEA